MNDTELRAHLAERHPGIGLATGPTGMYPEGRPTMHLEVSHEGQHRDYPTSQDHVHPGLDERPLADKNTLYVRYHSTADMVGVGELRHVTGSAAVVLRTNSSVDVYGPVAVVDQAHERAEGHSAGTPAPTAAQAGREIIMRLVQLEERLSAKYPRAASDGHLASIIGTIRDEAGALTERYEFTPPTGQCEFCHLPGVPLVAALADDTDQYVCRECHADERLPTIPLEALQDDRPAYVIARGDLVASAGRALTDDEIRRVVGRLEDAASVREAFDDAVYMVLGPRDDDEDA